MSADQEIAKESPELPKNPNWKQAGNLNMETRAKDGENAGMSRESPQHSVSIQPSSNQFHREGRGGSREKLEMRDFNLGWCI
jgi:hypothetical protein